MILQDLKILFFSHIFCPYNTSFCNPHYMALIKILNILEMFLNYYERAERVSRIVHVLHLINILFVEISDLNILLVNNIFYRFNNVLVCVTLML